MANPGIVRFGSCFRHHSS